METQAWSTRKDPTKIEKNKTNHDENSLTGSVSSTIERRKSPRFSSVAFEIKNDVAIKPKRKVSLLVSVLELSRVPGSALKRVPEA